MNIKETAQAIHQINKDKGFWDKERNVGELLMLVTSELAEALEADRKSNVADTESLKILLGEGNSWESNPVVFKRIFEQDIKDSFQDEIADAVIRLFDLAEGLEIDLEFHIKHKMEYNKTRERLHGKAY